MEVGKAYDGPIVIVSSGSTTCIDAGWRGTVLSDKTILICKREAPDSSMQLAETLHSPVSHDLDSVDPILREVFAQRLGAIASQMGTVLEQTAISVNVKDRKDFSCAVFNSRGELVANAPHVPVHLGP